MTLGFFLSHGYDTCRQEDSVNFRISLAISILLVNLYCFLAAYSSCQKVFICNILNDAISNQAVLPTSDWMMVNNELELMSEEVGVA